MPEISDNATLIDRIQYYIQSDRRQQAKALATLGDYLEECLLWEINFHSMNQGN